MNDDVEAQVKGYIHVCNIVGYYINRLKLRSLLKLYQLLNFDQFFNRSDGGEVNAPACTLELASLNNEN